MYVGWSHLWTNLFSSFKIQELKICFNHHDIQPYWKIAKKLKKVYLWPKTLPRTTFNGILCNTTMRKCTHVRSQKRSIVPYMLQSRNKLRYIFYFSIFLITQNRIALGTNRKDARKYASDSEWDKLLPIQWLHPRRSKAPWRAIE